MQARDLNLATTRERLFAIICPQMRLRTRQGYETWYLSCSLASLLAPVLVSSNLLITPLNPVANPVLSGSERHTAERLETRQQSSCKQRSHGEQVDSHELKRAPDCYLKLLAIIPKRYFLFLLALNNQYVIMKHQARSQCCA